MDEIIYRVYVGDWSNIFCTRLQYIAALQSGKNIKSLRKNVNNDTLEGLAADMAGEVFRFHYEGRRDSREVCFAFDLPYTFKVRSGGEIMESRRLHANQEKEFSERFDGTYRHLRQQGQDQEVEKLEARG